jgi:uncharacterized protein
MLKKTYYSIISDNVNQKQDKILFSTRTNQAFVISETVQQQLENEQFDEMQSEMIEKLLTAKIIVGSNENELEQIIFENNTHTSENNILYEVIQPSANCQLGCYYCGQSHTKDYLTEEYFDALLSRIRQKAEKKSHSDMYIGWFGGEPLMALPQIRALTPKLQALAAEFGMSYGAKIVTNGLSLKENIFVELVTKLYIDTIEITLDGTADFHDQHRYTKEGGKSFDLIFKNLLSICNRPDFEKLGCKVSVRCNVDKRNWEGVSPLIKLLAEHGLHKKLAYFYPIGVYSWGGNDAQNASLTKEEYAAKEID